jgi:hypothetical protein
MEEACKPGNIGILYIVDGDGRRHYHGSYLLAQIFYDRHPWQSRAGNDTVYTFGILFRFLYEYLQKKRTILPMIHGINNFCTLILALSQIMTGLMVYYNFVLTY